MKYIRVVMTEEKHEAVMKKAVAAGFPDIESFLLFTVGEKSIYLDLFNRVRENFEQLESGTRTTVRKLIGDDWDSHPVPIRINVGKMFASAVENGLIKVSGRERGASGHAVYIKI